MFFTYLGRELRRRMRQAILIALGLALGIGLVITVVAASNGVKNSQSAVLHALYGVGTDVTVTEPPGAGLNRAGLNRGDHVRFHPGNQGHQDGGDRGGDEDRHQ
jgi:putative ABC transport system permease protein